jgi:hypothetical protein
LVADAFIGNVQEAVFSQGASQLEAMTWPNMFSAIWGFGFVMLHGHPSVTYQYAQL